MDNIHSGVDLIPPDAPVLLLHEVPELPMTPYFRERTAAIVEYYRDRRYGRTAMLLPETIFRTIMQNYLQRDLTKVSQSFERRLFSSRDAALDRLLEAL